ncbi:hypothetical protein CROQUDRAFT_611470 [Cronartium quercuum f. sp. fusiforme G11]|uniref:Uncharacterized protein n=1 Tax=Cronartium quercuum f. sp. fusiforme G11 TaxID=708437 RepID=A0A9P6NFL8_9BASI|nr:hypothetical protein CROQUDRAFT_611470 [Cronartium quercuum f. sp. fusiforme G11]
MFDKISNKHLQVGAKSWRPLAAGDPKKRGGITANRGVFICNLHNQQQQASPAPDHNPTSPLHEPSIHQELPVNQEFDQTPGVHFASPHDSVPASAHSHHSGMVPSHHSEIAPSHHSGLASSHHSGLAPSHHSATHSVMSGISGRDLMANHSTAEELVPLPPQEDRPSTADLDAAVTEGILMRTREDIEEQERALAELQKAQELLALRESEIRSKEEAFQLMLEAEKIRIEEDAKMAQEAADRAACEAQLKAEAEQRAIVEQIERERKEAEREKEERQRELEDQQRENEERQREIQEKQREIQEKEQAMLVELENERQRLAEEAKQTLEENIREQRRREEEARLEEQMARIRAEEEARTEREEQIAAEQRAKEEAKRAMCNRIHERENALRTAVFEHQRQWNRPMAPFSPLPIRELNPVSYAQAYSSPDVYAYSLPPSPSMPRSPLFVPPEVKHAARVQQQKYEAALKRQEEERRIKEEQSKTAQLEAQLKAAADQLAAEQEQAERVKREHLAKIEELQRRTRATEQAKREELQEAELKKERERLLEKSNAVDLAIRQEWEAKRREEEEEIMKRERERVARLQAEQAAGKHYSSSQSGQSDDDETAARKRGAEAATYFMAKQALSRPLRTRKLSTSHLPTKSTLATVRQRRASYTETPPLVTNLSTSHKLTSPGSGFMVFSFDEVPGYAHDVMKEVESSYIMDVDQAPALDFLRHTEEGKSLARLGQLAAVQALVKVAQEIRADAIIKLTTQGPVAIKSNQVNFSARGLAVTLKFPSPDKVLHHTPTASMYHAGQSTKDVVKSVHNPAASAPVRALQTPALSMKSEPFDISSPKVTSLRTKLDHPTLSSDVGLEHSGQTPTWKFRIVPPSVSSKSSSPLIQASDVPAVASSSPLEKTTSSSPDTALPSPPNFTQPASTSSPKTQRSSREVARSRAQSVSRASTAASSSRHHSPVMPNESEPVEEPAVGPAKAPSANTPTSRSPVVKSVQEPAVCQTPRVISKPAEFERATKSPKSRYAATPATRTVSSPRESPRSNRHSYPSEPITPASPKPIRSSSRPRSILRQSSPSRAPSGRAQRADESPPPDPKSSFPSSPEARSKRYSATQVPLPDTPHQSHRLSVPKTPRQIPLPDSPESRRSVHFPDVWIGDHWDHRSPSMGSLVAPLTPKVDAYRSRQQSISSKDFGKYLFFIFLIKSR